MNKKNAKTIFSFLFAAVAVISYLLSGSVKEEEIAVSKTENEKIMIMTVLKDNSGTLIPISFSAEPLPSLEEQLILALSKTVKGACRSDLFSGLLSSSVTIRSAKIDGQSAVIDFSKDFLQYDPADEVRILEAIASICAQFDIRDITLCVDGEKLTSMPYYKTAIPETYNASIGINNFESFTKWIHDSEGMTVYYCKQLDGQTVYVPKTIRVNSGISDEEKMEIIAKDISAQSHLTQPLYDNNITVVALDYQQDVTIIECSSNLVKNSRIVQEAMDCFMLSLASLDLSESTVIKVDGVIISTLNDYLQQNSINNFDFLFN